MPEMQTVSGREGGVLVGAVKPVLELPTAMPLEALLPILKYGALFVTSTLNEKGTGVDKLSVKLPSILYCPRKVLSGSNW